MQLSHSCVGFLSKGGGFMNHPVSLDMFGIKRATNTLAPCANAFGLNAMSSGSALSRFHKISMFAFVAGMAVSTLQGTHCHSCMAASWVFAAQRLGGESYHCTSYPIHRLPYRSEVSPFLAEFFSDLVQSYCSYCSSHRVMTAKSCTDLRRMELERGKRSNARAESCQKTTMNMN